MRPGRPPEVLLHLRLRCVAAAPEAARPGHLSSAPPAPIVRRRRSMAARPGSPGQLCPPLRARQPPARIRPLKVPARAWGAAVRGLVVAQATSVALFPRGRRRCPLLRREAAQPWHPTFEEIAFGGLKSNSFEDLAFAADLSFDEISIDEISFDCFTSDDLKLQHRSSDDIDVDYLDFVGPKTEGFGFEHLHIAVIALEKL